MITRNRPVLFIVFAICLSFFTKAQKFTQFANDTGKFITDLNTYFIENTVNKEEAAAYIREFSKLWKENIIAGYYKQIAIKTSNAMLVKRMKPYPFFYSYFNSMISCIKNKQPEENYKNWQTCVDKILAGKSNRGIQDFFEMSENIFKNLTFYSSPSYQFRTVETDYKFDYDTIPKVTFGKITLIGINPRGDSIAIEETQGVYFPTSGKFSGKGGKVSWERCGLTADVYATLKKYTIDCKTGQYTSDSAIFTGKQYFDKPQFGKVSDRIITENQEPTFPRFDSYSKRLLVKEIYPDVDYDGGFGMRGPKFVGSGTASNPARIIVKRNKVKFLEVSAGAFGMNKEKIVAPSGSIKFFLDKDTIYHPGLSFTYQVDKRKVTILRGEDGLQKTPFANSFHKFDMHFEQIVWNIDEPKIDFNFLPNNFQGEAFFESQDFFNGQKMEYIRGNDPISPVAKMIEYSEKNNKLTTFSVTDLAKYIKYMANDLRPIIFRMAIAGLIDFNPESDIITIKQKLFDFQDNIKHKHDYDIITLHSVLPGKDNATLNLINNSYDIKVRGVKSVLLSDTQKVFMFPKNGEITLKKNRKMEFSGTVASGKFEFIGKDYLFDYEAFKINMKTIDSIKIYVESFEPDVNGDIPFRKVQTVIENVNGELRIDAPRNKSGWGKSPTFPSFTSFKESYTYYDKRSIFKGVYNRDKFYFKLDPFGIDSLDNFRNEGLVFDGEFVSSGIFPTFREKLTLQKDYSLGFIRQTPPGGFPVYGGKGNFNAEIRLSNKGLRGGGDLAFSASLSKLPDIIFFPDSANGVATTFDVKEQENPVEFPVAHGDTVKIHFRPYKELLQASDIKKPFNTYKESVQFKGRFDLTNKELTGKGRVDFEKADLSAKKILFVRRKFFSDTADFHLKAFDEEGFTFSTVNVNSKIDFDKREGEFISNGKGSYVRFDKNQYIAYMDRFKWFMDQEDIELGDTQKKLEVDPNAGEGGLDLEGPEFISVHPKQDSLRFFAPGAKYNLRKYIIKCKNVPFINVADARLFPKNGDVTIFKNAVVDTLKDASILANTVTKYHNIRNVTANIYGRRSYLAKGEYQYLDENNNPYIINFEKIKPDTTGQTISEGVISEKANFKFNDYFSFAGKVYLLASQQFLIFDGGTKIVHACNKFSKSYLLFSGEIDPKNIYIPIPKNAIDVAGNAVGSGIIYNPDTNMVYSAFISPRGARSAKDVIVGDGVLTFDKESNEYQISNREKLDQMALPGNYVSLNVNSCDVFAEGSFDVGADFGQVKLKTVGNAIHKTQSDSAFFNFMMTIDFFFDNGAIKKMAKDAELFMGQLTPTPFEGDLFSHGLIEILGKDRGDRALSELNLYGNYKRFPDEFEKVLVFNDVKMNYNKKARAFLSEGMIGLGNIQKTEIFRYVKGFIQMKKQRAGGDVLDIYLEFDPTTWYYFTYYKGTMLAVSSNNAFNNDIKELKGKNKKQDVDKGPSFRFDLANPKKKDDFLRKLKQIGAIGEEKKTEDEE
ncbi:MAG: hypothetical protein QM534_12855 [Sediminibacterium sp.]|nr:hypothetical protein [Sediminibacterium sp.]